MKKKGFTLIELLAVIVILAVIALIAVPIVLNLIEKARKGAAESDAYAYKNAVETSVVDYIMEHRDTDVSGEYEIQVDGNLKGKTNGLSLNIKKETKLNGLLVVSELKPELKGTKPTSGTIIIGKNGTVEDVQNMIISSYLVNYDKVTKKFNVLTSMSGENNSSDIKINLTTAKTSNTIQVTVNTEGSTNKIEEYTYYLNGEKKATENGTGNAYVYKNLKNETEYTVTVLVKDEKGNVSTSSIKEKTDIMAAPELKYDNDTWELEKEITVNYKEEKTNKIIVENGTSKVISGTIKTGETELQSGKEYEVETSSIKIKINKSDIVVTAYSTDGNNKAEISKTGFKIDTVDPKATLQIQNVTTNSMDVYATCEDTESGITKIELSDKEDFTNIIKTYNEESEAKITRKYEARGLTKNKEYKYYVRCTDKVGKTKIETASGTTNNIEGPTVIIENETSWTTSKNVTITYKGTLTNKIRIEGGEATVVSGTIKTGETTLQEGPEYEVTTNELKIKTTSNIVIIAYTTDGTNNESGSKNISKIDTTKPTKPSITNPTNENWTKNDFSLTVSSSDTVSGIAYYQYSYDNSSWITYENSASGTFITTPFTAERNQYAYIRACDYAGNCSESEKTYIRIDKTIPSVPTATLTAPNPTTMKANWTSATDSTSGIDHYEIRKKLPPANSILWENTTNTTSTITGLTEGTNFHILIRTYDKAGNYSDNWLTTVTTPTYCSSTYNSYTTGWYCNVSCGNGNNIRKYNKISNYDGRTCANDQTETGSACSMPKCEYVLFDKTAGTNNMGSTATKTVNSNSSCNTSSTGGDSYSSLYASWGQKTRYLYQTAGFNASGYTTIEGKYCFKGNGSASSSTWWPTAGIQIRTAGTAYNAGSALTAATSSGTYCSTKYYGTSYVCCTRTWNLSSYQQQLYIRFHVTHNVSDTSACYANTANGYVEYIKIY